MSWLRLDDGFSRHPKVAALSDREFRVHLEVLCYCSQYKTRGAVPEAAYNAIPGLTRPIGRRFLELGLWEETADAAGLVHDFERYNPADQTAAERMRRKRLRDSGAGVDDRNARRNADRNAGVTSRSSHAGGHARINPSPSPYISIEVDPRGIARSRDDEPERIGDNLERYVRTVGWMYEPASLEVDLAERGADDGEVRRLAAIAAELRSAERASPDAEGSSPTAGDSAHVSADDGGERNPDAD